MKGATLFSGIGAPEAACPDIDWRWCAEIDPFASAVHQARFPGIKNLGDVEKIDAGAVEPVDVVVFGSPCQSFSVAGRRLGLDDPRGNLALVALRLVERLRPRWFLFENVPGLLSSDEGRDFGTFLAAVGECGYGWAYRVLDAQYFGVPQRRRRLFVVGRLGDWRSAAAVLFEPQSLRGDSAPRREKGEGVAPSLSSRATAGGGLGTDFECDGRLIAGSFEQNSMAGRGTLGWSAGDAPLRPVKPQGDHQFIAYGRSGDVAATLQSAVGGNGNAGNGSEMIIAHALRGDGFDAGEDGTGRGPPLVPVSWTVSQNSNGFAWTSEVAPAVQAFGGGDTNTQSGVLAFDPGVITNPMDYSNPQPDGPCYSLQGSTHKHPPASAFTERTHFQDSQFGAKEYDTAAIRAGRIPEHSMVLEPTMAVRRLLPVECEKLQGFPPGFTAITYRGKPAADGPRYRALGNSMAVPVVRWILKRIMGAA